MMMIPKWGNYPGDGGGGITLVIDNSLWNRLEGEPKMRKQVAVFNRNQWPGWPGICSL